MKNLMVRTLSGLVLVAVFVGAVLGSQWSFGALLLLILVGGQTEFYKLARETGLSPQRWMGLAVGVLLFALNFIVFRQFSRSVTDEAGGAVLYLLLYIGLLLPTLFVCELFRRSATPLANLGATLLGVLYVAVPLSLLLYVPVLAGDGVWRPETVLCYIFIIWANDVFAYLVGMTFGRHRLCERLSPKKSWEGFFGGLAGGIFAVFQHLYFDKLACGDAVGDALLEGVVDLALADLVNGVHGVGCAAQCSALFAGKCHKLSPFYCIYLGRGRACPAL